jgi:hypothetical protein
MNTHLTVGCLTILGAILITGVIASTFLTSSVSAAVECKYGYLKVIIFKGERTEICLPPYIVQFEKIWGPECPFCGPVKILIDPTIFEKAKVQPEISIMQGNGDYNVTVSHIPDVLQGSFAGNTTMGLKGLP